MSEESPKPVAEITEESAIPAEQMDRFLKIAAAEKDAQERAQRANQKVSQALQDERCEIVIVGRTETKINGPQTTVQTVEIRPLQ